MIRRGSNFTVSSWFWPLMCDIYLDDGWSFSLCFLCRFPQVFDLHFSHGFHLTFTFYLLGRVLLGQKLKSNIVEVFKGKILLWGPLAFSDQHIHQFTILWLIVEVAGNILMLLGYLWMTNCTFFSTDFETSYEQHSPDFVEIPRNIEILKNCRVNHCERIA